MGTAIGSPGWRTGQDLLAELHSRTQLAQSQLGNLVDGQKRYFYKTSEAIIDAFDLPADKTDMLRDFTETLASLLDRAYPQAETKLQKLLKALESNNVKVELGPRAKKTLHITPEGEEWYVSAHMVEDKRWLFSLPIYKVRVEAEFPDILGLNSEDLYYLQAGWRASDEGCDGNEPIMGTTQPWQVLAWAAVRYGYLRVYLSALNLNMAEPTLAWTITSKSWEQQWSTRDGKKLAQQVAKQHPLGMLTWYLGDGRRHKHNLLYAVGDNEEYKPKSLVPEILQIAYQTGYGRLLDILNSDKWQVIKRLKPARDPVYANLLGRTFWLLCRERKKRFYARTVFKSEEEAKRYTGKLESQGIYAHMCKWKNGYIAIELPKATVTKLAENNPEWKKALKQLAQKKNIHWLLELAENPPLLSKEKFITKQAN
jgi:hypothetical protein